MLRVQNPNVYLFLSLWCNKNLETVFGPKYIYTVIATMPRLHVMYFPLRIRTYYIYHYCLQLGPNRLYVLLSAAMP